MQDEDKFLFGPDWYDDPEDDDDASSEPPCSCPVQRCGDTCQCHGTCTCYWHDTGQHYVLASNDCPLHSRPPNASDDAPF